MKQGRFLAELRRSNASGLHNHKPPRSQLRRIAIETELKEEESMSLMAEYYGVDEDYVPGLDDLDEPSPEDLNDIENEVITFSDDDGFDAYPTIYDENE